MDIVIGSDHAGFRLKESCKALLENWGAFQVTDVGVYYEHFYPEMGVCVLQRTVIIRVFLQYNPLKKPFPFPSMHSVFLSASVVKQIPTNDSPIL